MATNEVLTERACLRVDMAGECGWRWRTLSRDVQMGEVELQDAGVAQQLQDKPGMLRSIRDQRPYALVMANPVGNKGREENS